MMHRWQRGVGLIIFGTAAAGAALLWWAVAGSAQARSEPKNTAILGVWNLLYDNEAPSLSTLAAAVGLALLFAAGVALLERRIATRARRSDDGSRLPLSPRHVMAETRGTFHGEVTLTVLVPAHNEAEAITNTLASLFDQSRPPERVIVVADNCTDDTVALARKAGAEVVGVAADVQYDGALPPTAAQWRTEPSPDHAVPSQRATQIRSGRLNAPGRWTRASSRAWWVNEVRPPWRSATRSTMSRMIREMSKSFGV